MPAPVQFNVMEAVMPPLGGTRETKFYKEYETHISNNWPNCGPIFRECLGNYHSNKWDWKRGDIH